MLSPRIQKRLETARQNEATYTPNGTVAAKLADKTLIMFVGPVAAEEALAMRTIHRSRMLGRRMNRSISTDG
jgi:hypothetical protein